MHGISSEPAIIAETEGFIILDKPSGMHTVPLREGEGGTLLDWAAARCPEILRVAGRKRVEGGVLHRLDRPTRGLVLAARTQRVFDALAAAQNAGLIEKEYEARVLRCGVPPAGFPPPPFSTLDAPCIVESGFRAFGQGRRAVRPAAREPRYRTEIRAFDAAALTIRCALTRGFRHQIRCHLAWLGYPVAGDALYGGGEDGGAFGLCAAALRFADPEDTCRYLTYRVNSNRGAA